MKRNSIALILSTVLIASGCVSKKQHSSVQSELEACQEEKAQAEAQVISWEQRFDSEARRWESMGASINERLPQALSELNAERERVVKLVPDQVRGEVERYLDEYFTTVMTGFDQLAADNREVKMQLTATQTVLENLSTDTRAVSTKIDTTLEDERGKRHQEQRKREAVASRIAEVIEKVTTFDSTRVNCKGCPDRLKLRVKDRDAIDRFHGELTTQLSEVQTFATSDYELPAEDVTEAPLDEDGGGSEGG